MQTYEIALNYFHFHNFNGTSMLFTFFLYSLLLFKALILNIIYIYRYIYTINRTYIYTFIYTAIVAYGNGI